MQPNDIPGLVVGVLLVIFGGAMVWTHAAVWKRRQLDTTLDEAEREHFGKQYRRRMQASGLLLLVGILIPVGDMLIRWDAHRGDRRWAATFAMYWLSIIGLAAWAGLLAVSDMFSTRVYLRQTLARIDRKRNELEREAERMRAQSRAERS